MIKSGIRDIIGSEYLSIDFYLSKSCNKSCSYEFFMYEPKIPESL